MDVQTIATLIEKYGLSLVGLILLVLWLKPQLDQQNKLIMTIAQRYVEKKEDDVEKIINFNILIKSTMREIMAELNADWVWLWQFHNGVYGMGKSKIPFLFITLTHEVAKMGRQELGNNVKELPIGMFDAFAKSLLDEDVVIHEIPKDKLDTENMGLVMCRIGAQIGMMRLIRDVDGRPIAFVCSAWVHKESHSTEWRENTKIMFINLVQRMSIVLSQDMK